MKQLDQGKQRMDRKRLKERIVIFIWTLVICRCNIYVDKCGAFMMNFQRVIRRKVWRPLLYQWYSNQHIRPLLYHRLNKFYTNLKA